MWYVNANPLQPSRRPWYDTHPDRFGLERADPAKPHPETSHAFVWKSQADRYLSRCDIGSAWMMVLTRGDAGWEPDLTETDRWVEEWM